MLSNATAPAAPRLRLIQNSMAKIDGQDCLLQQRVGDKWLFISTDNKLIPLTDGEVVRKQAEGGFVMTTRPGVRQVVPAPPSPLCLDEAANRSNLRKLAYVSGCKAHPDYSRSRVVLIPIIKDIAAGRRRAEPQEKVPGFTTVIDWISRFEEHGSFSGAAALTDRHFMKGNFNKRLAEYQERAIEQGIEIWLAPRVSVKAAYATVCVAVASMDREKTVDKYLVPPEFVDRHGNLKPPSLRTFARRCGAVDPALRDGMKIGTAYVKKNYRTFSTMPLPDRPYKDVEVDHCTIDLLIKHKSGIILGRPDLVVFKDRATGMILGWGLSVDQPSYASFLTGLKSAIYGPDLSHIPGIKNKPFWFGRIENLYHDNALHEIGDSIKKASPQLGFNLVRLQPRQPWLKGALERFFRTLGVGLIHALPGTTLEHAVVRKEYETLGDATLTFDQCEAIIARWICDVHNASPSKSLGLIRGLDDGTSPIEAWTAKKDQIFTDLPQDPDLFIALAGQITQRSVQNNGVKIDHIIYESPLLARVIGNPKHRRKARHGTSSLYDVARDPHDLGYIYLIDPYTGDRLRIPACAAHAEHANGLTLVEHQIIIARTNEAKGQKTTSFKELQETRAELNQFSASICASGSYKTTQRKLGRWLEGDRFREQKSRVQAYVPDGIDYLQAEKPYTTQVLIGAEARDQCLPVVIPSQAEPAEAPQTWASEDDYDLDELRKSKMWD